MSKDKCPKCGDPGGDCASFGLEKECLTRQLTAKTAECEGLKRQVRVFPPVIDAVRAVAKEGGYAIGVHGSEKRDLDLIAAPWTEDAVNPQELAEAIGRAVEAMSIPRDGLPQTHRGSGMPDGMVGGPNTQAPHGRIRYSIFVAGTYIDLSILAAIERRHSRERCLERQLTAKTAECEQAQAVCAAMRGDMDRALTALETGDYDTVRYWVAPVDDTDNPGKPILDRLAKADAEIADLRTCLAMVAGGEIDLHVHQDGSWYYEMQACGLSEQGGMYDHPADAAMAGLAEMRKGKDDD